MFHCHYMSILTIFYSGIQLRIPCSMHSSSFLNIPSSDFFFSNCFLFFSTSAFQITGQVFCRIPLTLSLAYAFSWLDWDLCFGGEYHRDKVPFSFLHFRGIRYQYDKFLHCKVMIFFSPFFGNKSLSQPSVKSRGIKLTSLKGDYI